MTKLRLFLFAVACVGCGCASTPQHSAKVPIYAVPQAPQPACSPEAPSRQWGLVVGINRYLANPQIADLKGAVPDAWTFYHYLASPQGAGIPAHRLKLLLNEEATYKNVVNELGNLKSCPQDEVIIYFAGHGAPDPKKPEEVFLLVHDTELEKMVSTAISLQNLHDFLKRRDGQAARLLLLLDACHSGSVKFPGQRGGNPTKRIQLFSTGVKRHTSRAGWGALSASASDQFSLEGTLKAEPCVLGNKIYAGGLFTCHLLRGLSGHADGNTDGRVTLGELEAYLRDKVSNASRGQQIPQLSGSLDREVQVATPLSAPLPVPHVPDLYTVEAQPHPLRPWLWVGLGMTVAAAGTGALFAVRESSHGKDINEGSFDSDRDAALGDLRSLRLGKGAAFAAAGIFGALTAVGLAVDLLDEPQSIEDVYQEPPLFEIDFGASAQGGEISFKLWWD